MYIVTQRMRRKTCNSGNEHRDGENESKKEQWLEAR